METMLWQLVKLRINSLQDVFKLAHTALETIFPYPTCVTKLLKKVDLFYFEK